MSVLTALVLIIGVPTAFGGLWWALWNAIDAHWRDVAVGVAICIVGIVITIVGGVMRTNDWNEQLEEWRQECVTDGGSVMEDANTGRYMGCIHMPDIKVEVQTEEEGTG